MSRALSAIAASESEAVDAISLVPSETRLSPWARRPLATDLYNRYFFNQQHDSLSWQFRGGERVANLETSMTYESLCRLAGTPFVNTRPISGMSAMTVALMALGGDRGRTVVTVEQASGGHYATAALVQRLGFNSATVPAAAGLVDNDRLREVLRTEQPSLVYLDMQNTLHFIDVARVAWAIAEERPATRLHVDCSHTLGFVLAGVTENPLRRGADSMGGSTHKSFPGPQKGVLFARDAEVAQLLELAQFDVLSSHHFASTLALGLAAREYEHFGSAYAQMVVENANTLAATLDESPGFTVLRADETRYSHTHQVWVQVGDIHRTMQISDRLAAHRVRVNVHADLPSCPGPALRLGVNEVTFEGAGAAAIQDLGRVIIAAYAGDDAVLSGAAGRIRAQFGEPYFFTGQP